VTVGIARLTLFLADSHSLKQKRMVLRRVKDLVRGKFNVSVAEVGEQDKWQLAVIGLTVVGGERRHTEAEMDEVLRFLRGHADVVKEQREMQTFGDDLQGADFRHWEP
jgi:uncharacterized protein YlxP (DUF503 family)